MNVSTPPAIVRIIDRDQLGNVVHQFGVPAPAASIRGLVAVLIDGGTVPAVRAAADEIRLINDPHLPDRPRLLADALDALIDDTTQRPVNGSDAILVSDDDRRILGEWRSRCERRSVMLEPVAGTIGWLVDRDPRVEPARRLLDMLPDVDLLLPGIDTALRPVLARYTGRDEPSPTPAPVEDPARVVEDAAWLAVWLYGNWRWLTTNMGDADQRETAAAAVERAWTRKGFTKTIDAANLRWWWR